MSAPEPLESIGTGSAQVEPVSLGSLTFRGHSIAEAHAAPYGSESSSHSGDDGASAARSAEVPDHAEEDRHG